MTMNQISKDALAAVILLLSIAAPVAAAEYDDAYARGDYATTLRLVRPLADRGDADAQYRLGFMYAHGEGVTQDYVFAVIWYRKAAEQGYGDAQYVLGLIICIQTAMAKCRRTMFSHTHGAIYRQPG
jgi:uncharacterized protein